MSSPASPEDEEAADILSKFAAFTARYNEMAQSFIRLSLAHTELSQAVARLRHDHPEIFNPTEKDDTCTPST